MNALPSVVVTSGRAPGDYCLCRRAGRLRGRRADSRATVAVAHSILVSAIHILDRGVPYNDLGADRFQRPHLPEHQARNLVHQLRHPGYDVKGQERPGAA